MTEIVIDELLKQMMARKGSDLHLVAGDPPRVRLYGDLQTLEPTRLKPDQLKDALYAIMPARAKQRFEAEEGADFAHAIPGVARFRVNVLRHLGGVGAVLRAIPTQALTIEQLALPEVVRSLCREKQGLLLVTGKTGSGKSTTLAAMLDSINAEMKGHIITIEDPIEFTHPNKRCLVHQREIGPHAQSFATALRAAVREDPDIILVGEMRDLETIQMALEAAEKGMLVFGTLHTNNAAKTIDRIVNVFPSGEQEAIRQVLGETIRGILAQQLMPKVGGGRIAALEILFGSPQVGNMIREGKTSQITSTIQTGRNAGMIAMDQSIVGHFEAGVVTKESALDKAIDKAWMKKALGLEDEKEAPPKPAAPAAARKS